MKYKIKQGYTHSITEEIKLKQVYRDTVIHDYYITKFNSFIIEISIDEIAEFYFRGGYNNKMKFIDFYETYYYEHPLDYKII